MDKPDVDAIEGLSPAISIDQKSASHNPRSIVGTVTEIYDFLWLLFARIGHPHCPSCGREISQQGVQQIVDQILRLCQQILETKRQARLMILSPVVRDRKGEFKELFENLPIASREHWKERIEDYPMIVVIETLTGENVNVHDEPMYLESSKIGQTPSNTEKEFEVYKVKGQLLPGHMSWKDPTGVEYGVWFSGQSIPNAEKGKPPLTGCIAADFVTIRERLKPGETKTPTP